MYLHKILKTTFTLLLLALTNTNSYAQKETLNQFTTELLFNGTLSKKWATEFYYDKTYSSTIDNKNLFHENVQNSFSGWANYYYSPRWKLTGGIAYFDNKNAPDIGQYEAPEWRFTLQGTYYFHKIGYTLSTRTRLELRNIQDIENEFQQVFRFRQQIKYLKPINSQLLRKGVFYGFVSEEIYLKSNSKVTGISFFDRNRFQLGGGYIITQDLQLELCYTNDFAPEDDVNKITNNFMVQISYNNLFLKIKKKIKKATNSEPDEEKIP